MARGLNNGCGTPGEPSYYNADNNKLTSVESNHTPEGCCEGHNGISKICIPFLQKHLLAIGSIILVRQKNLAVAVQGSYSQEDEDTILGVKTEVDKTSTLVRAKGWDGNICFLTEGKQSGSCEL
jgi:hypothetical protein